ncbi:MAG TPA: xanthine dehydrogenase family protein molybdopterin-binding subunit [Candidatus Binataceae bacterium]|nr:xanthine dehydrogenase family protein molybdopterin-binding subunit [Candidatus Binataceae bacterium]
MAVPIPKFVGARIRRREDPRLVRGEANYVDDVHLEGTLSAAILRSPHAHAKIRSIDVRKALNLDGVVDVTTGEDLRGKVGSLPCAWPAANRPFHPVLALDKVRFVGEPVAIAVASDAYLAHDALELIEVDYEPLEAVLDPEQALAPGAPLIHEQFGSNVVQLAEHPSDKIDEVMRQADKILRFRFANQRLVPMSMETRGVLARWDAANEELVFWSSTQMPHIVRSYVAEMIGIAENQLRTIAPEVGGGFGAKSNVYREEALIPYMARKLRRPVKWIEQRREHLATLTHGRGQVAYVEAAVKKDGTVLGIKARLIGDMGAYLHLLTPMVPGLTGLMLPNTYKLRAAAFTQQLVFTNKMSTDTYRGAGLPEAIAIIERVMDLTATEFGLDPAEVRRRNLVARADFPWTSATGLIYDTGNYEPALDKTLALLDYKKARTEQAAARKHGRYLGIGLACYAEMSGVGPSNFFPGLKVGGWESATVRIEPDGKVVVLTGSSSHGQGHETSFAQVAADALGIEVGDIKVIHGDTGRVQYGIGTFASRSMAVGGAALMGAIAKLQDKMKKIASFMMEVPPDQLSFAQRAIVIGGDTAKSIPLQKVIDAAYQFRTPIPGLEPGLEASHFFEPPNFCTSFGTHASLVEVDPETGGVKFLKYVALYDCGTVINPLIVEGQVHGGTVQGIGQALCEEVYYDQAGQLISGSLMDYALPRAATLPWFEVANTVTRTTLNPLGAKGMGESGCIGAVACVVNAVIDALQPFGVKQIELPLKAERIWRAIQDAKPA